jgi:hypothetical protein
MTFRQKTVVGTLVSFSFILVFYLIRLVLMLGTGPLEADPLFRLWFLVIGLAIGVTIVVLIITHIIGAAVVAARTKDPDPYIEDIEDERDELIKLKGARVNQTVGSLGVFAAMLTFVLGSDALVMFALLIIVGLLSEIIGSVAQLVLYRRDA